MSIITTEQAIPDRHLDARPGPLERRLRGPAQRRLALQGDRRLVRRRARRRRAPRQRRRLEHHRQRREPAGAPALAGLLRRRAHPAGLLRVDLDPPRRRRADRRGRARDPRRQAADHADRHDRRSRRRPRRREDRPHARDGDRPDELRDELEHGAPGRRLRPRQRGHADRRTSSWGRRWRNDAHPRDLREPAARLAQPQAPARGGRSSSPPASSSSSSSGLKAVPPYDEDDDRADEADPAVSELRDAIARRRRRADRDAGVQLAPSRAS